VALVCVRYFAGAARAAGCSEESIDEPDVAQLLATLRARHGAAMTRVLEVATVLVDGTTVHDHRHPLTVGQTVEVLPPFAGG
jgi:molybdopterin synthase sulfur carrier subunit